MTSVPRLFERMYAKIIKGIEASPEKKQKIFYWAVDIGTKYQKAKKTEAGVPLNLKLSIHSLINWCSVK